MKYFYALFVEFVDTFMGYMDYLLLNEVGCEALKSMINKDTFVCMQILLSLLYSQKQDLLEF